MKTKLLTLAFLLIAVGAKAFKFDGIELNQSYVKVAQQISKRGYFHDSERNCLCGNCQGTMIYLNFNYTDVSKRGMLGQLIVEVPMKSLGQTMDNVYMLFNVVYHQVRHTDSSATYAVDDDGTELTVSSKGDSVFLTYNTPYYRKKQ